MSQSRTVTALFTASGTWTAPAGVTEMYLYAFTAYTGVNAGPQGICFTVTPNTSYSITIGTTTSIGSLISYASTDCDVSNLKIVWVE
jgi:hypothetical protein